MSDAIEHERTRHGGAFVWMRDGARLGWIEYRSRPGRAVIEHTEVGEALRGQGAGRKLVQAIVDWARAEGTKLEAECPYARSVLEKSPEYKDVLFK